MFNQALRINSWGKNVYVKIPITNSKGYFTGNVIKKLNKKNKIKYNFSLQFNSNKKNFEIN